MRHVRDQSLSAPLFRDVEVGGDEAAAVEGNTADLEYHPVRPRALNGMGAAFSDQSQPDVHVLFGIAGPILAAGSIEAKDLL